MTKVYPNTATANGLNLVSTGEPLSLTVWNKSLLFNCTGFTVFDAKGNLVYRVDNYVAGDQRESVLMDFAGKPLFTIRKKRLSLRHHWLIYDGETRINPLFSVKKSLSYRKSQYIVHISSGVSKSAVYEIKGSYSQRSCAIYDNKRRNLAKIMKKEISGTAGATISGDVFRLVVEPDFDSAISMAFVVLLDKMFGPRYP